MKKNRIVALLLCAAMLFAFAACGTKTAPFVMHNIEGEAKLHTTLQMKYLGGGDYTNATDYARGMLEASWPVPVELSWYYDGEGKPEKYILRISEKENMSDPVEYKTKDTAYQIYNLMIGTTYYWTVSAIIDGDEYTSAETMSFTTESTPPRNLYVDGITNVRDMGGWELQDGGRVKQGLIYRCGALSNADGKARITKDGIKMMKNTLGVKSEIDLRGASEGENGNITKSPLGKGSKYLFRPMNYDGIILETQAEMMKKVFKDFAKEENYPFAFHCAIGTDRTGAVAFILNGFLGVPEESLYYDYMFSNYGEIFGQRDTTAIDNYIKWLGEHYEGERLSDRIRAYLLDIGMTEEELEFISAQMIEK